MAIADSAVTVRWGAAGADGGCSACNRDNAPRSAVLVLRVGTMSVRVCPVCLDALAIGIDAAGPAPSTPLSLDDAAILARVSLMSKSIAREDVTAQTMRTLIRDAAMFALAVENEDADAWLARALPLLRDGTLVPS